MTVISALWCAICTWNKAGNSRMSVSTTKPRACYSVICIKKTAPSGQNMRLWPNLSTDKIFFVKEYFLFCHKDNVGEPKRTCIMRKSKLFSAKAQVNSKHSVLSPFCAHHPLFPALNRATLLSYMRTFYFTCHCVCIGSRFELFRLQPLMYSVDSDSFGAHHSFSFYETCKPHSPVLTL